MSFKKTTCFYFPLHQNFPFGIRSYYRPSSSQFATHYLINLLINYEIFIITWLCNIIKFI